MNDFPEPGVPAMPINICVGSSALVVVCFFSRNKARHRSANASKSTSAMVGMPSVEDKDVFVIVLEATEEIAIVLKQSSFVSLQDEL